MMPSIGTLRETQEEYQSFTAGGMLIDEPGFFDDICYTIGLFTHVNSNKGIVRFLQNYRKFDLK
jgi:hypothetical protein